ncbi:MAG: double-cubane-cluster-containing anaerobic reductase [Thermodesulfobacteriota bacterium]
MENERLRRVRKTTLLHLAMEAKNTLLKIEEEFPDNPAAMDYFYTLYKDVFNDEPKLPTDKKIIGTMCVQVPQELIHAVGAFPLRLCNGASAYDQVGAEFMPAKSCPVVRATMGMLHVDQALWGESLQAVVIPTTCDQKKKSCQILADMGYPVYALDMPATKESEASRFYWQESIKKFTLDMQKITGVKITAKRVQAAIAKVASASSLYRKLQELRKSDYALILGKDMFLVTNAYFFDEIDRWQQSVSRLVAELEERKRNGFSAGKRQAPRILFTGSPPIFPNLKVPILVEQAGGVIVADETCSSGRLLYDSVAFDEATLNDMIPALADRSLKPCTCPCLTPNKDRLRKLINMAKEFEADGVVYQAFSGCLPYEMEQKQVAKALAEAEVPMLYVETDYSPEDMGQLSTRIEAFIESILARRRKKKVAQLHQKAGEEGS